MKTRLIVLIFAAVMMAACCGNSGNSEGCHADGKACCKGAAEKACSGGAAEKACCKAGAVKKIISAQVFIKPEKVEDFLAATKDLIEKSRAEEGCVSYSLYQNPEDKSKLMFFEEWKNQAAVEFHFATEHFKQFGKTLEECASAPAVITVYDSTGEEKL